MGIDPAKNLSKYSKIENKARSNVFTLDNSIKIKKYGQFDIITANHVCTHVDDLNNFFKAPILNKKGMFVFEVSYLVVW